MGIGALLQRTWQIVWGNRFLIWMGFLVGFGANTVSGIPSLFALPFMQNSMFTMNPVFSDLPPEQQVFMQRMMGTQSVIAICGFLGIGIPLWVVSRVSVGGVIAATKNLSRGTAATFRASFSAGRARMNPMMGIGALASIPVMLLVIVQLVYTMGAMPGMFGSMLNTNPRDPFAYMSQMLPFYGISTIISVIGGLVILPFVTWGLMSERACVLEGTGMIDSLRRGGRVLLDHAADALKLTLVLVGIGFAVGLVSSVLYFGLLAIMALVPCLFLLMCLLIPVIFAAQGLAYAYYHTIWTLAWRQWVPAPAESPAAPAPAA